MRFIYYNMYTRIDVASVPDASAVRRRASESAFGGRLITNNFRAVVAEAMVALVLEPVWRWCSADYAAWDFEREDGVRLEVKQSAAKQTWHVATDKPTNCLFDIRARKGRYEGATWIAEPGRHADLYVLAHHGICDDTADQADPQQWTFYVILAADLPDAASISLSKARSLSEDFRIDQLADAVEEAALRVRHGRS